MGKVFIEESTLSAIGDAIRSKTGGTELIAVPSMADEITAITTGGSDDCNGMHVPEETLVISGDCQYMFYGGYWDWFVEACGNKITTKDIANCSYMFSSSDLKEVPFKLNFTDNSGLKLSYLFASCSQLEKTPVINLPNAQKIDINNLLTGCFNLRDINGLFENEEEFGANYQSYINTNAYSGLYASNLFRNCNSMRTVPTWLYLLKLNPESTAYPAANSCMYNSLFSSCYSLDEAVNIPVWNCKGVMTTNMFSSFVYDATRLQNLTFETNEDGSAIVTRWKTQTIDFNGYIGYVMNEQYCISNNSGITKDKWVKNAETYEALKNDADWFTTNIAYSRYNHDSAVATINSLPDTSAYLATAGGTNTIKFKGESGSATDGGAINTLTAEEIAVAAAKGWTVSMV